MKEYGFLAVNPRQFAGPWHSSCFAAYSATTACVVFKLPDGEVAKIEYVRPVDVSPIIGKVRGHYQKGHAMAFQKFAALTTARNDIFNFTLCIFTHVHVR